MMRPARLTLAALCVLLAGCAGRGDDSPDADVGPDERIRVTYIEEQSFDDELIDVARRKPADIVVDFPGRMVNLSDLPPDVSRVLDVAAENGSGIRLVPWDESVRSRSLGLLELRAAVRGARYLRDLYQVVRTEMRRLDERHLGDYDVEILFDPHSGALRYLRFNRVDT